MRLDGLLHDLRHAARALRRSPGFTLTAVATLAVGIGVNAAVFSVTSGVLLKGFPLVERNDRLVYIAHRGCCVSYADFEEWRAAASFAGMAITHGLGVTFARQGGFPDSYTATEVSAGTFRLVGRSPKANGDIPRSEELLETLRPGRAYGTPLALATFHLACSDIEVCADWTERVIVERHPAIFFFLRAHAHALRKSPRWPTLARQLNLTDPPVRSGTRDTAS